MLSKKVLAANVLALRIIGTVLIKIQLKTKSVAQEFLIAAGNCISCLLGFFYRPGMYSKHWRTIAVQ